MLRMGPRASTPFQVVKSLARKFKTTAGVSYMVRLACFDYCNSTYLDPSDIVFQDLHRLIEELVIGIPIQYVLENSIHPMDHTSRGGIIFL